MRNVGAFDALISNLFGADYAVFYCLLNPENRIQKTHNPTGKEKQGDSPSKKTAGRHDFMRFLLFCWNWWQRNIQKIVNT